VLPQAVQRSAGCWVAPQWTAPPSSRVAQWAEDLIWPQSREAATSRAAQWAEGPMWLQPGKQAESTAAAARWIRPLA